MTHAPRRTTAPRDVPPARTRRRLGAWFTPVVALGLVAGCSSGATSTASTHPSSTSSSSLSTVSSAATSTSPGTLPPGVLASIPLDAGAAPIAAVGGFGSVWVAVHRGDYMYRVDPATNTVQKRVSVVGGQCQTPVSGAGRLWAAPCTPAVAVVDPASDQVVGTVPGQANGVFAIVDGIPWAYAPGAIVSLDPRTYKVTRTFRVDDANPRFVSSPVVVAAYGDGAFWVINVADDDLTFGGSVVKIDAKTGKVDHVYDPPDPGDDADIQFLDHAVWLKGDDSGGLVRLDTATGQTRVYVLPGFQPLTEYYTMAMGVAMGDLWIRASSSWVSRFDPVTGTVVARYPADPDGHGGYAYVSDGSLWVANFGTDTIWRDKIG